MVVSLVGSHFTSLPLHVLIFACIMMVHLPGWGCHVQHFIVSCPCLAPAYAWHWNWNKADKRQREKYVYLIELFFLLSFRLSVSQYLQELQELRVGTQVDGANQGRSSTSAIYMYPSMLTR